MGEGRLQQMLCYRARDETVGMDLERRVSSSVSLSASLDSSAAVWRTYY